MNTQETNLSILTPEMIGHYEQLLSLRHELTDRLPYLEDLGDHLIAVPGAHPFVIRFEEYMSQIPRVAYLSVVDGQVQWRYSQWDPDYARCPVLRNPRAIRVLEDVFMQYYKKHQLPDALSEPLHQSERMAWINDWFFSREEEVSHAVIIEQDIVAELCCDEGACAFLERIRRALHFIDQRLLKVKWLKAGKYPARILAIRFDRQVRFVDVAMPGNLYLHLLLCLNELCWPRYQIRRYRDGNVGNGGILGILSVREWDKLAVLHGGETVDMKFERITSQTPVDIQVDHEGRFILGYDKNIGL